MVMENKAMPVEAMKAMKAVKEILGPTGLPCFVGIYENGGLAMSVMGRTGFMKDESIPYDFKGIVGLLMMWQALTPEEKDKIYEIAYAALMREDDGKEATHG